MTSVIKLEHDAQPSREATVQRRTLPVILGWRERVFLPRLQTHLHAKIDTGARSCALHVENYAVRRHDDGRRVARFEFLAPDADELVVHEMTLVDKRVVKSSSGHEEERAVINLPIRIGQKTVTVETSLTNRQNLEFPMLIGRNLLRKGFLVDVRRSFLTDN